MIERHAEWRVAAQQDVLAAEKLERCANRNRTLPRGIRVELLEVLALLRFHSTPKVVVLHSSQR